VKGCLERLPAAWVGDAPLEERRLAELRRRSGGGALTSQRSSTPPLPRRHHLGLELETNRRLVSVAEGLQRLIGEEEEKGERESRCIVWCKRINHEDERS